MGLAHVVRTVVRSANHPEAICGQITPLQELLFRTTAAAVGAARSLVNGVTLTPQLTNGLGVVVGQCNVGMVTTGAFRIPQAHRATKLPATTDMGLDFRRMPITEMI
jgi:hypothetical protein